MSRTICLSALLLVLGATPAVASKGGLPQLDPTWFASQVFWLLIHFVVLYLIASKLILPRIAAVLDRRESRIANDLDQADRLNKEATLARQAYDQALQDARSKAQAAREAARVQALAERTKAEQKLADELAAKAVAAQERIAQASEAMRARMRDVAAEVATDIMHKVAGIQADRGMVDAALSRILDQRRQEAA
jgi:F-type H+-transporting ATPase subunit b